MNIKQEINRATPIVEQLNDAIRDNPLAAGLIGAGLVWMVFGTRGLGGVAKGVGTAASSAASNLASAAATAGSATAKAGASAASALKAAVVDEAETAASIVPDQVTMDRSGTANAVKEAGAAVSERVQAMTSVGREYGAALQSRLSESFEKQPLLIGAIGLAIGAGIASTFATTDLESEWMGEAGGAARNSVEGAIDDAKAHSRQVLSELQDEAARQGLTVDAAKEAASSVADKLRNVAATARESLAQPLK